MEFEIDFEDGAGPADVEIRLSGPLTLADFTRFAEGLTSDARFRAGLTLLVDLSALDTTSLSDDGVQAVSEPIVERDWHFPPRAVAIVAPSPQTLEAVRKYRAHLGGSRSNRHLFGSRAEALAWLQTQQSS